MKIRKCVPPRSWFRIALSATFLFVFVSCRPQLQPSLNKQTISGADGASITITISDAELAIEYDPPEQSSATNAVYVALGTHREIGSAVVPFQREQEGSTVFLPFKADLLFLARARKDSLSCVERTWQHWKWSEARNSMEISVGNDKGTFAFRIPRSRFGSAKTIDCAIYAKDLSQNEGWGRLFGCSDPSVAAGTGDKYIPHYLKLDLTSKSAKIATSHARYDSTPARMRIYQLFVRLFGNTNETRKQDGMLAENGVGKFNDINDAALKSLRDLGITHIWLTGVLQQATGTSYPEINQPADDTDLLKGIAGSPYAIKDYFDVCPDYAQRPEKRLDEFRSLLDRIHKQGMKALIDFVPNHVARSYNSDVKPELNFGNKSGDAPDDSSLFFAPQNNFFYLKPDVHGPPLRMPTFKDGQALSPTCKLPGMNCDGLFDAEKDHGKVTGNNKVSWTPDINDWYETVKLNYGFDFTKADKSVREYPNANTPDKPVPDTWMKMDRVLTHWQEMGVDGFRCDMSHMVPPEFWNWTIAKARARRPDVVFIGEAYDNDPAKVPGVDPVISKLHGGKSNVMFDLLEAGFNAVYDDPTYRVIKKIYEGPGWANDIDDARGDEFIFENSLRYAENHDEVRLAAKSQWGGLGMKVGPPVSAILFGLSRGPVMLYNGQETGEPAEGIEGFGNTDARTSIFDYWSMPEVVKWVNDHKYDGGRLSPEQKQLRSFYTRLVKLAGKPAFASGICIPLNGFNRDNSNYGRLPNEQPSGHWLYSFLRYDAETKQRFLVGVNLNPNTALKDVKLILNGNAIELLGLAKTDPKTPFVLTDKLAADAPATATSCLEEASTTGIWIGDIPPLTPYYFEFGLE